MEAEKVTKIEEGKDLIIFTNALAQFDIKESVIQDLEQATALEITDTASETVVRKFRQTAKTLQVNIEKHRLKLNREFKDKTDTAAGLLEPRITAVYNNLNTKVRAVEAVKAEKKAEADRIRQEAEEKINGLFNSLDVIAKAGLQYNRSSEEIAQDLGRLETFEISAVGFCERFDEAERVKTEGIATMHTAFENRLKWETDQSEIALVKKEQEAEAKKLEAERADFEKARVAEREKQDKIQAKLDLEREIKEKEAAKIAAQEAEKTRKANEKIRLDRAALENEKKQLLADLLAADEKEYAAMWDAAHLINLNMIHEYAINLNRLIEMEFEAQQLEDIIDCHEEAIVMNVNFIKAKAEDEKVRIEQLKKDKVRAKLIAKDKKTLSGMFTVGDNFISRFNPADGEYKTDEAAQVELDLIVKWKRALEEAEIARKDLV